MWKLRRIFWAVTLFLVAKKCMCQENVTQSTSETSTETYPNRSRALKIEGRQDMNNYQTGSYYPYQSPAYPPPSYGPPPPEIPPGMVHLEFAFDEIVLRCIAEEPYEHIVWSRYRCPQQLLFGGEGVHIADGSNVYEHNLYDVHIRGHDGTIISELLIKRPLAEGSEGIYQCEVWPHLHGGGSYSPYAYQNYNPPRSNIFIIGGDFLLEDCYNIGSFGTGQGSKLTGINNKEDANKDNKNKATQNLTAIKPRRNASETRKDTNSKQLRYSLKYIDNTLYSVQGHNVTSDYFRPVNKDRIISNVGINMSNTLDGLNSTYNLSRPVFAFTGRSNDKFRQIFQKQNGRKGKITNIFDLMNSTDRQESNQT